jgi:alpha-tubulin suppressor-like RCC1 family protein
LRHKHILTTSISLLIACGPTPSDQTADMELASPDMGADMAISSDMRDAPDLGDLSDASDMTITSDMAPDPCEGIDCGAHGTCAPVGDQPSCVCDTGYVVDGLGCALEPAAPIIDNLPAEEMGGVGELDSFQLMGSDVNPDDALAWSLTSTTCAFPVTVDAAGLVSWTCAATTTACQAVLAVEDDGGLRDEDTLTISCANGLPSFTSTPPTTGSEGTLLSYVVACQDPDGAPVTLSVAPDDTCGGALTGATYAFVPGEHQGGTTCLLRVLCDDGEASEAQSSMVAIREVNIAPMFSSLPSITSTRASGMGSFLATATDADLPAQSLAFSLGSETCSFPVAVAGDGAISFICGAAAETCAVTVRVSDGDLSAQSDLTIACTDITPSVSGVAITPEPIPSAGAPLTCAYTFTDPNNSADQSTIEWLVGGQVTGMGQGFTAYGPADSVACRVTPRSSAANGAPVTSPALIAPAAPTTPPILASGGSHTCAIVNGGVQCWGGNASGQLGNTAANSSAVPVQVAGLTSGVTAISADAQHTCAIHNGAAKCWGDNNFGQLGNGTNINSPSPVQVTGLTSGVTAIAVGDVHTCAVHNGAAKCWGNNTSKQLGYPYSTSNVPIQVTGLTSGVTAIAAGSNQSCAIHSGAAKCWGSNSRGALGNNSTTNSNAPVQVTGLTSGVTAIDTNRGRACAIHSGAAKCWGSGGLGALGNGATADSSVPVQVTGLSSGVTALELGYDHACAIHSGALKCWGSDSQGQLGNGAASWPWTSSPVQVTGLTTDSLQLSVGARHTCAVHDAVAKCWGANTSGQLGNGATTDRSTPVLVSFP